MKPLCLSSLVLPLALILASGCDSTSGPVLPQVEIESGVKVRLREIPVRIDVSKFKVIGDPLSSDLDEALQIIGRLKGYDIESLRFIRFTKGPALLDVDFAFKRDYFRMSKSGTKWRIYAVGGIDF